MGGRVGREKEVWAGTMMGVDMNAADPPSSWVAGDADDVGVGLTVAVPLVDLKSATRGHERRARRVRRVDAVL
jgi:hypothetical protein